MAETLDDYLNEIKTRMSLEGFLESYTPENIAKSVVGKNIEGDILVYDEELLRKIREPYQNICKQPNNLERILDFANLLDFLKRFDLAETLCGIALKQFPKNPEVYRILSNINNTLGYIEEDEEREENAKKHYRLSMEIAERGLEYIDELTRELLENIIASGTHLKNHAIVNKKFELLHRSPVSERNQESYSKDPILYTLTH